MYKTFCLFLVIFSFICSSNAADYYVSPQGSADGDGSKKKPWDLRTALIHPSTVKPGDRIWLRGGTYKGAYASKLVGTKDKPIIVRSYPGEWARIDGDSSTSNPLYVTERATHSWYWDIEFFNSNTERILAPGGSRNRATGVNEYGVDNKLINLIVHDNAQGIGFWTTDDPASTGSEMYGNLIYNNGWDADDRPHGHAIYTQNRYGTKLISDNIVFSNYGFGVHAYGERGYMAGLKFVGNVWFNTGAGSIVDKHADDCLIGGSEPAERIELINNYSWAHSESSRSLRLGWASSDNKDVTLSNNYFVGAVIFAKPWQSITMQGNTFYSSFSGVDTSQYPNNKYLTKRPKGVKIVVRRNKYDRSRAHVIVYNWKGAKAVRVNLSRIVRQGRRFQVRNAQNFFGRPVVKGFMQGSRVRLRLKRLKPVQPIGGAGNITKDEETGKEFNVFVVLSGKIRKYTPRN